MYSFAEGLREEMKEQGVTVTALLPGATASDFHHTAGMDNTVFGSNDRKNDPELAAKQGLDALLAGKDHVIGGDAKTRRSALVSSFLPERMKQEICAQQPPNVMIRSFSSVSLAAKLPLRSARNPNAPSAR